MFVLQDIKYVTVGRVTLTYSDTVDKTDPANIDPANFILSGGAQFVGNIVIFGMTISFDIALGFPGQLFDVQTPNIVSATGEVVDPAHDRKSFYYGIGGTTPMLVSLGLLGEAYIISDPALVGKVTP